MSKVQTSSFDDDWAKVVAVLGALSAFGFLPKKWAVPIAAAGLLLAFRT